MSTCREAVEGHATIPQDPAAYFRHASATGAHDRSGTTAWNPGLFRAALHAGALEPLEGLSELARGWRRHFEEHPVWNPGAEMREVILASDDLTKRDKRQFEKFWTLAVQFEPRELARHAKRALDRLIPESVAEAAWRDLLVKVARDIRWIYGKPKRGIVANPADAAVMPRVLEAVLAYLRALVALDHLRHERIEFMVRRYRQLQSIAGLIEGPPDFAGRHTEYSLPRRS